MYIILLTKINIAFLFTPSPPFCHSVSLSFINNVYVSLADSCPQDASHWVEIGFWCSINHKQCKTKDIYSVGEGKRNWADILSHYSRIWVEKQRPHNEIFRGRRFLVTQRKGNTVLFVSSFVPTLLLVWIAGELREMDKKAELYNYKWLLIVSNF